MTMTTTLLQRFPALVSACAAALALALLGCATPAHAQSVAVMVNGEPITDFDIEQRTKLDFLSTHKASTRQEVIQELIDQKLKIREAKQYSVDPGSSDIDAALRPDGLADAAHFRPAQQSARSQGIRPDTLKQRIKSEMVWAALVRGRFKESLQVGEKEVNAAAGAATDVKDDEEAETESFEYKMQPIVLIVPKGIAAGRHRVEAQGSRNPARPHPDLRRGQCAVQEHAKRRDPRRRGQDLGRHAGAAA